MKPNLVICHEPNTQWGSNLLDKSADDLPSANFEVDFSDARSIAHLAEWLELLEKKGYHLINDRDWVFHSESVARILWKIDENLKLGNEISFYTMTTLTRTGGLRKRVYELLEEAPVSKSKKVFDNV